MQPGCTAVAVLRLGLEAGETVRISFEDCALGGSEGSPDGPPAVDAQEKRGGSTAGLTSNRIPGEKKGLRFQATRRGAIYLAPSVCVVYCSEFLSC